MLSDTVFLQLCHLYGVPWEKKWQAEAMYDGYAVGGEAGTTGKYYHLGSILRLLTDHVSQKSKKNPVVASALEETKAVNYMESERTLAEYELFFGNEKVRDALRKIASGSRRCVEING